MTSAWEKQAKETGSQPTCDGEPWPALPPKYWPLKEKAKGKGQQPLEYVYRTMRARLDDLYETETVVHPATKLDTEDDAMREHVVRAICEGSRTRSPFLHASTSIDGARRYKMMGESSRGETDNIFVRIHVGRLRETGELGEGDVIDMSSTVAFKKFFQKKPDGYGEYVKNNFAHAHCLATGSKELLVKWRGRVPWDAFEVVDEYDGSPISMLRDFLVKKGSQPTSSGVQPTSAASERKGLTLRRQAPTLPTSSGARLALSGAQAKAASQRPINIAETDAIIPPMPTRSTVITDSPEKKQKLPDEMPEEKVALC